MRSKSRRNSAVRSMGMPKPPVRTLKPRRTAASTESGLWAVIQMGGDLVELPVVGERLALEGLEDDVDRLLPAHAAGRQLQTEALELVVLVAAPEPDVDPAAGQQIQRGDLLGDDQRMVERDHDDGGAHPQPRRLGRDVRRELHGAREIAIRGEVMLGQPDVAEAERLGGLGDLDPAREDLLRGTRRGRLHEQEGPEVHGRLERIRYQGCGCPGTLTRSVYTEVRAVKNNVRRSGPPNARLAGISGVRMMPSRVPSEAKTQVPPGPVQ